MMADHRVRWMFHSTAMVADYVAARDALITLFGLRVMEDTVMEDPGVGRRGGMCWLGDGSIELGQPIVPGAPADRFVTSFGSGMHSLGMQVHSLDAALERHVGLGVRIGARPQPTFAFTHPRDTAGLLLEFGDDELDFDPRFGAPLPDFAAPPLIPVDRMAWVGAVVAEPPAAAARLAEVFDTTVTFVDATARPGDPVAGVSVGDCTLALYPVVDGPSSVALWGVEHPRPRVHLQALHVTDLGSARAALAGANIALVRTDDHTIVIDPAATGSVAIALTDRLLPGDPRARH